MSKPDSHHKGARHSGAAHRRAHLWLELVLALTVLAVFVPVKHWFEHSRLGRWLEVQTHVWLQTYLRPPDSEQLPVVVVDLAELKPIPYELTVDGQVRTEFFTPRSALREVIGTLAASGAAAVAVDVDLSLEPEFQPGTDLARQTQQLFDEALAQGTNCHIFFGVKRNEGLNPESWLGNAKYVRLAASLTRLKGLVREMPSRFVFPGHTTALPSLACALAQCWPAPPRSRFGALAREVSEEEPVANAPDFRVSQYLVDYSALDLFLSRRIPVDRIFAVATNGPSAFAELGARVHGKLVLLGDATPFAGGDTANLPGRDDPVPGIYVHACGTYTLTRAPLYRLNLVPGMVLATIGSLVSVGLVYMLCFRHANRHHVTTIPLTILLTLGSMALFIIFAIFLATWAHVMWLEVIAVCLVLAIHCFVEILVNTIKWEHFPDNVIKALVVTSTPGKEKK